MIEIVRRRLPDVRLMVSIPVAANDTAHNAVQASDTPAYYQIVVLVSTSDMPVTTPKNRHLLRETAAYTLSPDKKWTSTK